MSATSGKVALVKTQTALTCSTSCVPSANIVDFVGYGSSATGFEGTGPTPTLCNTTSALRAAAGCTDSDNNAADFTAGTVAPRNSARRSLLRRHGPGTGGGTGTGEHDSGGSRRRPSRFPSPDAAVGARRATSSSACVRGHPPEQPGRHRELPDASTSSRHLLRPQSLRESPSRSTPATTLTRRPAAGAPATQFQPLHGGRAPITRAAPADHGQPRVQRHRTATPGWLVHRA